MSEIPVFVGSLNRATPYFEGARGAGLSVLAFDPRSGGLRLVGEERGIDNPTFLCADPHEPFVYATSEVPDWHEGTLTAYRYDPAARRLAYINKQPSLGSVTAYCSLDTGARNLLVANYGGFPEGNGPDRALAVLPIRHDGGLAAATSSVSHSGRGPNAARQERPHPHCVLPSPDGRFVVVADLGLDVLASYRYGPEGLSSSPAAVTRLAPGRGPRHVVFHPGGHLAVVICELDSTVSSLRFDPASGALAVIDTVSTLPEGHGTVSHCSDVRIHPNGCRLYAANRGHDSIADIALDPGDGRLTIMGHRGCGGRTPRHLAIAPSGRHLVVANQDSDALAVFRLDGAGALAEQVGAFATGTPMCVAFLAAA